MTRILILSIILFFQVALVAGQTSLARINLDHGTYKVGFQHQMIYDSSRTYSRIYDYNNQKIARPISFSIWYPSDQNTDHKKPLKTLNYFEVLKAEEEWEYLPNEQVLNWFYYINTPTNQALLQEETRAYRELDLTSEKFPTLIYTPSHHASSIENFALCEYLASHGYVIVSSASRGTETRWFSNNNAKEMETQARDVEFLMAEIAKMPIADINKIAVLGFSFGGLSNLVAQMRNDKIKAIVSLDGTERYQYQLLQQSPFFALDKIDVPYIHMAQKDIPEQVLKEDNIDPILNTKFELFDDLTEAKAYQFKLNDLSHSYFSNLGILFEKRDSRQDKSDDKIMSSYKRVSVYTLKFLNAYLKDDANALAFIENAPDLVTKKNNVQKEDSFTFQDFNELAANQNYEDIYSLYQSTLSTKPSMQLPEGMLNILGLQLVFNPSTSEEGINVFLLAVELYPNSANLFDSLAEGYLFIGNKTKAIESFEKSLALDSTNQNAINRLKQLRK